MVQRVRWKQRRLGCSEEKEEEGREDEEVADLVLAALHDAGGEALLEPEGTHGRAGLL